MNTIITSTVTSVVILIMTTAVVIIVYVAIRKFGGSKLILQVTGDSMDIVDGTLKLPSIVINRYSALLCTPSYLNQLECKAEPLWCL